MPVIRLICFGFALFLSLVILDVRCGRNPPSVCDEFFKLPALQQEAEFRRFPIAKQLTLYRCGMSLHPKTIGFAYLIADGGASNITFLLNSLKGEGDEPLRADMIYIFEVLAERGELKGRSDVERQLHDVVSTMHGGPRERAEASLTKISKSVQ